LFSLTSITVTSWIVFCLAGRSQDRRGAACFASPGEVWRDDVLTPPLAGRIGGTPVDQRR
jgi:hypothetical protein